MSVYRVRAYVRLGGGLATWARDQMAVRYSQAIHLNEGLENEELKKNEVTDTNLFECDLPLMDEAHAIDAYNTLTSASVLAWVISPEDGDQWFIDRHVCHHDENPPSPCETVESWTT